MNIVFTLGRHQPVQIGHGKLFSIAEKIANKTNSDFKIFTTRSFDSDRNPLDVNTKLNFMRKFYPKYNIKDTQHIFSACRELASEGYEKGFFIVGEDRYQKFIDSLLPALKNPDPEKNLGLKDLEIVSVNRSNEDASSTQVRKAVINNDWKLFVSLVPGNDIQLKKELFKVLKNTLGD